MPAMNRVWPPPEVETVNDGVTQTETVNSENPKKDKHTWHCEDTFTCQQELNSLDLPSFHFCSSRHLLELQLGKGRPFFPPRPVRLEGSDNEKLAHYVLVAGSCSVWTMSLCPRSRAKSVSRQWVKYGGRKEPAWICQPKCVAVVNGLSGRGHGELCKPGKSINVVTFLPFSV